MDGRAAAHASDGRDRSCLIHSDAAEDAVVFRGVKCIYGRFSEQRQKQNQILQHMAHGSPRIG